MSNVSVVLFLSFLPVRVRAVSMALELDSRPRLVCVYLVRHTQLVVADNFVVRNLLPLAGTLEVLRH